MRLGQLTNCKADSTDPTQRMPPRDTVYILGTEHPRGLACARSLARRGLRVVAVDYRLSSAAAPYTSRYIHERVRVEPDSASAVERLEELGNGGVMIPTNDDYLVLLARNHERLSRKFALSSPSWDQLQPVMDRVRANQLAAAAGIPTRTVLAPKNEAELDAILCELDFAAHRYVLKLEIWTKGFAEPTLRRKSTYGRATREELRERFLSIAERTGEHPTIQQLVPGATDMSIGVTMVLDRDGRCIVTYCVRRLRLQTYSKVDDFRHPYDLGGNVFCETVHDPEAVAHAQRLVRQIGWVGLITVELRRDATDGSLTFVKVDPRPVRSTSLSTALGMDVANAVYDVACGGRNLPQLTEYPAGVCWIWLDSCLGSLWRNRRNSSVRRELAGMLRRRRDIKAFAFWDSRDPLPFLMQLFMRLTFARSWVQPKRFSEIIGMRIGSPQAPVESSPRADGAPRASDR